MTPLRRRTLALAVFLLAALHVPAARAELAWPATDISAHARAWFAQLGGDEAAARAFFAAHFDPAALTEAGIEVRLERRRGLLERTQGLEPLEIVNDDPAEFAVRCRAGNGDDVVAWFTAEPAAPHRLRGVRLEAGDSGERRPPAPAGPPLTDREAAAALLAHLDAQAAAGAFSGVALLARDGRVLQTVARGAADRGRGTAITPRTRFNLASLGKLLTRTAVAQLAEQGALSLADPLSKYLPDWPHADSITVGMLCAHRSGVGDFFGPAYDALDHATLRHNRDYLALFRDQPLWFAPGTAERYSNGGYVLLGEVIAKASGEDYYDYLARHVLAPAGMTRTVWPLEGDGTADVARGYTRQGAPAGAEVDNAGTRPARGSAAGGGYATADDLLAFDRALFGAKLCSPGWAAWVAGAPEPRAGASAPAEAPGAAFAGGAPGISTEWLHEGGVTLLVLTNRDPEVTRAVVGPLHAIVRRMTAPPRR